jgi:hypothetical protein
MRRNESIPTKFILVEKVLSQLKSMIRAISVGFWDVLRCSLWFCFGKGVRGLFGGFISHRRHWCGFVCRARRVADFGIRMKVEVVISNYNGMKQWVMMGHRTETGKGNLGADRYRQEGTTSERTTITLTARSPRLQNLTLGFRVASSQLCDQQ